MTQIEATRYELWKEPDGYSFFASTNDPARRLLAKEAEIAWECVANSYEDAQQKKHADLGWEPYKPMSGDEGVAS